MKIVLSKKIYATKTSISFSNETFIRHITHFNITVICTLSLNFKMLNSLRGSIGMRHTIIENFAQEF